MSLYSRIMMKQNISFIMVLSLLYTICSAQQINFTIKVKGKLQPISPYIYGSNQVLTGDENYSAMRLGGNRLTGYNWENNASNAGSDYQQSSDSYLTSGLGAADQNKPGLVITDFHDKNQKMNAYSLVTLQLAGYVAKDKLGTVTEAQVAPSSRWSEVKFKKDQPFSKTPDLTDNYVYTDELVNFLVSQYGSASTNTGIKGYALDNEPALWPSTHPRIHPNKTTCQEIVQKGIDAAKAVKDIDKSAEIFGPVLFGFSAFTNFLSAPDWNTVKTGKSYSWFIDYYLDKMKEAEAANGKRLLDVLDIHWYPEAMGDHRITESNATTDADITARLQAPRTLWDPTYTEKSWITQSGGKAYLPLITKLKESIDKYYPGTKLGITEITYGGPAHVSGGIAMADVIGIFAKYGVYFANLWPLTGNAPYLAAAYKIYRNYDGNKSTFGDFYAESTTDDFVSSSVYSSVKSGTNELHIIAINKNIFGALQANFSITGDFNIQSGRVWSFDQNSANINEALPVLEIKNNVFNYSLPPLSVCHFVLKTDKTLTDVAEKVLPTKYNLKLDVYPNPFNPTCTIDYTLPVHADAKMEIISIEGKLIKSFNSLSPSGRLVWDSTNDKNEHVASGVYSVIIKNAEKIFTTKKIMLVK
jgi:mannan endo-1,4-beta-mannosidase